MNKRIIRYLLAFLAGGLSALGADFVGGPPECPEAADAPTEPSPPPVTPPEAAAP